MAAQRKPILLEVPRMLRRTVLTALTAVTAMLVASCAAQPKQAEPQAAGSQSADPQAAPSQSAAAPQGQGWQVRIDRSQSASDPDNAPGIDFTPMGATGFHYVGGPAGTLWMPGQTATGDFTLAATFTQNKPASHTTFYGLVFGGSNLGDATERYLYFQVAQNGTFLIKERTGNDTTELEGGQTKNDAVQVPSGSGSAVNKLEVRVAGNTVSYVVNGTVVHTTPRAGVFAMTDGVVGARVNHVLDVTASDFRVQ
jgi:hypothetical protein